MDIGYPEFGFHLNRTGRPMIYACSWPVYQTYSGMTVRKKKRSFCGCIYIAILLQITAPRNSARRFRMPLFMVDALKRKSINAILLRFYHPFVTFNLSGVSKLIGGL